jgi:hypothetical protein
MTGGQTVKGVSVSHRSLLLAFLVLALVVAVPPASADNPTLVGTVGMGDAFVIALADASGKPVTRLEPGTYTLLVHDQSQLHDFHLFGPGVDVATPVEKTGDFTFTVNLTDGKYRFVCDPHFTRMNGTFTVGSAPTAPPPAAAPQKLAAGLSASGRASLLRPAKLVAGEARIVVSDRSAKDGFRLAGPGGFAKSTGVAFRGTVTWKLALRPGRYVYGSVKHPKARAVFTVLVRG